MFPLEFPLRQLARAKSGDWVLDPFCGRGTTNFAARLLGLPSVGIDSSRVAVSIAQAKLVAVRAGDVSNLCQRILAHKAEPLNVPSGEFWRLCYHEETLEEMCKLREELIRNCSTPERIALRAVLLGLLHGPRNKGIPSYLSNQMPRTYATKPEPAIAYWRRNRLKPVRVRIASLVARRAKFSLAFMSPQVKGKIVHADTRTLRPNTISPRFKWVVTSPPYLGMYTYRPDQWIRDWFLGGPDGVDYSQEDQLGALPTSEFTKGLATVWDRVAAVCDKSARLVVRFGALPSVKCSPSEILKDSFQLAGSRWSIVTIRNAGVASSGKRQAHQFSSSPGRSIEELDLHAILEE